MSWQTGSATNVLQLIMLRTKDKPLTFDFVPYEKILKIQTFRMGIYGLLFNLF